MSGSGKSSCVRATALIVCMAQIGSFVPASSVTLGIHDAVQTYVTTGHRGVTMLTCLQADGRCVLDFV
jgi:hypothetical protein